MKKSQILLMGALVMGVLQPARGTAQPWQFASREYGPYLHLDVGGNIPEGGELKEFDGFAAGNRVSYDPGMTMAMGFGFEFNRYVAVEFETGWTMNSIDSMDGFALDDTYLSSIPLLVNAKLQLPIPNTIVVPFIGAGVGGAATVFDTDFMTDGNIVVFGSDSDFVFAWQGFAGVRFDINENMSAGVVYKYFWTDDSEFSYSSYYFEPDLNFELEGMRQHQILLTFLLRF